MEKPLVLFLVGPTASGKSEVALELAGQINAEIISADSMQVYRGIDILSAKPVLKERQAIPHYLIDVKEPQEEYNAAMFREQTLKIIKKIRQRKKIPLIVGGTGLYIKALIEGIFEDKGRGELLRKKLFEEAEKKGNEFLYEKLKKIDPQAAQTIHPNNLRRVVRALEVFEVNKKRFSALKKEKKGLNRDYNIIVFGITMARNELYRRVENRVDEMFEKGVVKEVARLREMNLSRTASCALGIKQITAYLNGGYSGQKAKELLKRDSRRFAKRQLTWFKKDKNIIWLDVSDNDTSSSICAKIREILPENFR